MTCFDTDKSGSLSRSEFRAVLTQQGGKELNDSECDQAFDDCDLDQSGLVDMNEFVSWATMNPIYTPSSVAAYPSMAGKTEKERLDVVLNWAWTAKGTTAWLEYSVRDLFEASPEVELTKAAKQALRGGPRSRATRAAYGRTRTAGSGATHFHGRREGVACVLPRRPQPLRGLTSNDILDCVQSGVAQSVIDKLGLWGQRSQEPGRGGRDEGSRRALLQRGHVRPRSRFHHALKDQPLLRSERYLQILSLPPSL